MTTLTSPPRKASPGRAFKELDGDEDKLTGSEVEPVRGEHELTQVVARSKEKHHFEKIQYKHIR